MATEWTQEFKNWNKSVIFKDKIIFISHLRPSNKTWFSGISFNVKFQNSMLNFIPVCYEFIPEWHESKQIGMNSSHLVWIKIAHTDESQQNKPNNAIKKFLLPQNFIEFCYILNFHDSMRRKKNIWFFLFLNLHHQPDRIYFLLNLKVLPSNLYSPFLPRKPNYFILSTKE